ncbi:GNAT family N-acetyltransferase [Pseudomonas chlororaphis]|uniref:GNAT family N-acetyltransferase n=1 Tax=Pseudomonas chlororaphis TaxID=587753 RepID=UPI0037C74987
MTEVKTPDRQHDFVVTIHESAPAAGRERINELLDQYNVSQTGISDNEPLDLTVTDPLSGEVVGGLVGRTSLGVFFINYFYLPDTLRGKGYGSQILRQAERLAALRGCRTALLFTMEIQAPAFYEKNGYEVFGRVECNPRGNARLFMRKPIQPLD